MIDRHFDPKTEEQKIYKSWEDADCFKPADGADAGDPYTLILPPPNVTGSLHMGHALNHTLQDILCRFQRMRGRNVLWQPGVDHAGIATQLVVERELEKDAKSRPDSKFTEFETAWKAFQALFYRPANAAEREREQELKLDVEAKSGSECFAEFETARNTLKAHQASLYRLATEDNVGERCESLRQVKEKLDTLLQIPAIEAELEAIDEFKKQKEYLDRCVEEINKCFENPGADDNVNLGYLDHIIGRAREHLDHLRRTMNIAKCGKKALAHAWSEKSRDRITEQIRRLGSSLDWSKTKFTLDEDMTRAVNHAFVRLHNDGLIYRESRIVHWDPKLKTALSDLEVEQKQVAGTLWHLRYPLAGGAVYDHPLFDDAGNQVGSERRDYIVVATTRPETMLGDAAVAVHPDDDRYKSLVGKQVMLPIVNRHIPVIADPHADPGKGSGAVKITPAHDFNDFAVGQRHALPIHRIMTDDARITRLYCKIDIPDAFLGLDCPAARQKVLDAFSELGLRDREEATTIDQPVGGRTGAVIEPLWTDQWYLDVKQMAARALDAVRKDKTTRFFPKNWEKAFSRWMDNVEPWCISRQIWWGHPISAWIGPDKEWESLEQIFFVAESESEMKAQVAKHYGPTLEKTEVKPGSISIKTMNGLEPRTVGVHRSTYVLDTWFSSALWPLSTQGWPDKQPADLVFYPGAALVTAHDIIFFWVARMMMMGLYFTGKVPFRDVYLHAIVRDEQGRKMSKSEGNVIDPLDLIDGIGPDDLVAKRTSGLRQPEKAPQIAKETRKHYPDGFDAYGADALRFTLAAMATGSQHINLSVERVAGYRNFGTKLWNATRFAQMNDVRFGETVRVSDLHMVMNRWIVGEAGRAAKTIASAIEEYRFNDAANAIYRFVWDILCDWYLELAKPVLYGRDGKQKDETRHVLGRVLEDSFKLLHPFSPFITEKLWQETADRKTGTAGDKGTNRQDFLMYQNWPDDQYDSEAAAEMDWVMRVISTIRSTRADLNVPVGTKLSVRLVGSGETGAKRAQTHRDAICQLARLESFEPADNAAPGWIRAVIDDNTLLALDIANVIDTGAEIARLQKQLGKIRAEITTLEKRIMNKAFRAKAPEHVVAEQGERLDLLQDTHKKLDDACKQLHGLGSGAAQ